jgi:radical SAM protein with 4Fe4S-binding SPASM domain
LLLTGGEPLIRSDFLDIYSYAKNKGMIIVIFTNGTLITSQIADFFKELPPHLIEITLYGITKETYENTTGTPGSFEKCMKGIDLIMHRGLPLKLKTQVTTLNKHETQQIKRYAEDLGVDYRYDPYLNPGLDGSRAPFRFRLPIWEAVDIEMAERKTFNAWLKYHQRFKRQSPQPDERLFTCGIGHFSFYIAANGKLKGCLLLEEPSLDLLKSPFKESWYRLSEEITGLKRKRENRCATCMIATVCNQCPAWSKLEEQDIEKPVRYICETAHLRAEALGIIKKEVSSLWQRETGFKKEYIPAQR